MSLWVIRIFYLILCTLAGYAVSQYRPDVIQGGFYGTLIGFGLGGVMVGLDHMLKGFSLRAFSAATFGLFVGTLVAWMVDASGLFIWVEEDFRTRWLVRLGLFLAFSYLGMVLAMRSNKEDFSLLIPYVRFKANRVPDEILMLDTSVIVDGRVEALLESRLIEGIVVVPQFILQELQTIADSHHELKRQRGRRGLEMLNRLQRNPRFEIKVHEADVPEEVRVDSKLLRLARTLDARVVTNDYNLGQMAALNGVECINLHQVAQALKPIILPGDLLTLRMIREGKEKGQGIGYLPDGTMVVVNDASHSIGKEVDLQVQSLLQTGAGVIIFADRCQPKAA